MWCILIWCAMPRGGSNQGDSKQIYERDSHCLIQRTHNLLEYFLYNSSIFSRIRPFFATILLVFITSFRIDGHQTASNSVYLTGASTQDGVLNFSTGVFPVHFNVSESTANRRCSDNSLRLWWNNPTSLFLDNFKFYNLKTENHSFFLLFIIFFQLYRCKSCSNLIEKTAFPVRIPCFFQKFIVDIWRKTSINLKIVMKKQT